MRRDHLLLALLAALGLLATGCGGPSDDDDGFNTGVGDDDDDDDDTPGPDDRGAYVEFARSNTYGESSATATAISAWYNATPTEVRVPIPDDLDSCWSGTNDVDLYGIPIHQHDVGTPSITLLDGSSFEMSYDEVMERWLGSTSAENWESNQEYEIAISGGADREAATYPGVLGTPAPLQLLDMDHAEDGLFLEWYGGNNNGHVELRFIQESQPDGEKLAQQTWVACRLLDDGQHVIDWADLKNQNDGPAELSLSRMASTNFDLDGLTQGMAVGISTVKATYVPPDLGEE